MSSVQQSIPTPPSGLPPQATASESESPSVDHRLVEETRQQIREIVNEISTLSESSASLAEFCTAYLSGVVSALAASGGAIWLIENETELRLQHQVEPPGTLAVDDAPRDPRHMLMLKQVAARGESILAAPRSSAAGDEEVGNPTDHLLIIGVVQIDDSTRALVEIFQRAGGGPTTHRGYLRFVLQMVGHFVAYLKNHELRSYNDREALWDQLESFTLAAHRSLDAQEAAYTIANQSRSLIGCDRVCVALRRGRQSRLTALSGVESFDRRATEIQLLEKLAAVVAASGQPLFHTGDSDDLPPQIATALDAYLDRSHVRAIAIVPLVPGDEDDSTDATPAQRGRREVGLLIVERFNDASLDTAIRNRIETVAQHSATALTNAQAHSSIILMPVWRAIARQSWLFTVGGASKLAAAALLVAAIVVGSLLVPADFRMESTGRLQPTLQREVFAGIEGRVAEVMVNHGQQVHAGQVLLRLENTDLQVEIENLHGRQAATAEEIVSVQRGLLDAARLPLVEQHRLNGRFRQLTETQTALAREMALLVKKRERLTVRSPIDGVVVTWDAHRQLDRRPVTLGDRLLTVVDPKSRWVLELDIPEKRLGHVKQARNEQQPDLHVTFSLGTHPGSSFDGRIASLRETAEPEGPKQGSMTARVEIESTDLPPLHPGATASAKIDCGQRSLAYVWLHDAWETVQTQVWWWF